MDAGVDANISDLPPKNSQPESVSEAMQRAVAAGISIIPIDHANKRPEMRLLPRGPKETANHDVGSTLSAKRIVDPDTLEDWCNSGIRAFAVIGGEVSGGLVVLDFDVFDFFIAWLEEVGSMADGLPVQTNRWVSGVQVLTSMPARASAFPRARARARARARRGRWPTARGGARGGAGSGGRPAATRRAARARPAAPRARAPRARARTRGR